MCIALSAQEMIKLADSLQAEINKVIELVRETIERRPESSTLFHMLNYALQKRGICENILLAMMKTPQPGLSKIHNGQLNYAWLRMYYYNIES